MRIPRKGKLVLAAAAGVIATMLAPTAASAAYYGAETDYAVKITGSDQDSYGHCSYGSGVWICFQPYGDIFWVWDRPVNGEADGLSPAVEWRDVDGTRSGTCVSKHGTGTLARCNKNFTEGHRIFFRHARYDGGTNFNSGPWLEMSA
jgi:hypothetical protein